MTEITLSFPEMDLLLKEVAELREEVRQLSQDKHPGYRTAEEQAELERCHPETIRQQVREGKRPCIRLNGRMLFEKETP